MTTFNFNNSEDNQPQTHVFIIGVGRYEFLNNPSNELISSLKVLGELKPLKSSPLSAKRFAEWMATSYRNINAPLGSIEILTSSSHSEELQTYAGTAKIVEPPTLKNIKIAFDNWLSRCNAGKYACKNVAIFYFCGHGVGRSNNELGLLVEDFGEFPTRIFKDGMINFEDTRLATQNNCKASSQYFFIDSCCEVLRYPTEDKLGSGLIDCGQLKYPQIKPYTLRAASPGESAHGVPSGLTYFTDSLLQSFDIFASECDSKDDNLWQVKSSGLKGAVDKTMNRISNELQASSYLEGSIMDRVMHTLDKPPLLPITISVIPPFPQDVDIQIILKNSIPENNLAIPPYCSNILASREVYTVNINQPERYKSKTKFILADRPIDAPLEHEIKIEAL